MSWCDLDLTFYLDVMTLSLKIGPGYISETVRLMLGKDIRGCGCATSWCDLDLTFDLAIVTLTFKILSGLCIVFTYGGGGGGGGGGGVAGTIVGSWLYLRYCKV